MKLKIGDIVTATIQGDIVDDYAGMGEDYLVNWTSADASQARAWFDVKELTLIEPPIVLPEVPGTIVQIDPLNEHDERATFAYYPDPTGHEEHWSAVPTTKTEYGFMGWITTGALTVWCREYGYRVIPAAEAEGVSE